MTLAGRAPRPARREPTPMAFLDSLSDAVSATWWSYPLIFAVAFADVLFPVVPSETAVVTAGVLASNGDMYLPLVILLRGRRPATTRRTSSAATSRRRSGACSSGARTEHGGSRGPSGRSPAAAAS
jgi:hypothetical protein